MADAQAEPTLQAARIGASMPRYDGRPKVTGEARYASDQPVTNPAYGYLHMSSVAKGRIRDIDDAPPGRCRASSTCSPSRT